MDLFRAMMAATLITGSAACAESHLPPLPDAKSDTCGATAHADTIGTPAADHDFAKGDRPFRVIAPNSAVTMDHRPERLNVDTDEGGIVTRLWCG